MSKQTLPTIRNYGDYSSDNYGAHSLLVSFPNFELFYSYQTIVAYREFGGDGLVVSQNDWGTTTGKHLNWIDDGDKGSRIPYEEFKTKLNAMLERRLN